MHNKLQHDQPKQYLFPDEIIPVSISTNRATVWLLDLSGDNETKSIWVRKMSYLTQ